MTRHVATAMPKRLQEFVGALSPERLPAFYYLHLAMPHLPWRAYGTGEIYGVSPQRPLLSLKNNDGGEWLAKLSEYRFLLQARYTDLLLGEVFERLKILGMWDETLVVVTADHGRSFRISADARLLQPENIDGVVYTPLFIKRPNQKHGSVDDSNLMAYDVLPTLASMMDITLPWQVEGLPAGDPGIAARGDQKEAYMKSAGASFFDKSIGERVLFSDRENFPDYASRPLGSITNPDQPLSELIRQLNLGAFIERSPAEFEVIERGTAVVDELHLLKMPKQGEPPLGLVVGNLQFETTANTVLVSVNGRFVTGSPLVEFRGIKHTFMAMLPKGVLGKENDISVYVLEDQHLLQVDIR